jgi:hypothetical protein
MHQLTSSEEATMLTYTMDVEERSRWIIATPPASVTAQPYFASEVGDFYARERFATVRSDKNSFIVFFAPRDAGVARLVLKPDKNK